MSHSGTDAKTFPWEVEKNLERTNEIHDNSIVNNISKCDQCMRPIREQCADSKFRYIPFSNRQDRIRNCRRKAIQKQMPYHMKNCEEPSEEDIYNANLHDTRMLSERKETRHRSQPSRYLHTKLLHPDDRD